MEHTTHTSGQGGTRGEKRKSRRAKVSRSSRKYFTYCRKPATAKNSEKNKQQQKLKKTNHRTTKTQ